MKFTSSPSGHAFDSKFCDILFKYLPRNKYQHKLTSPTSHSVLACCLLSPHISHISQSTISWKLTKKATEFKKGKNYYFTFLFFFFFKYTSSQSQTKKEQGALPICPLKPGQCSALRREDEKGKS